MTVRQKFPLGQTVITRGADQALKALAIGMIRALGRDDDPTEYARALVIGWLREHAAGHWGNLDKEDQQANEYALANELRLMSVYQISNDVTLWIITEADRSVTTILLPEDY